MLQDEEDLGSDSSDEDYVPDGGAVSSEGEASDGGVEEGESEKVRNKKRSKTMQISSNKRRKGGICLEGEENEVEEEEEPSVGGLDEVTAAIKEDRLKKKGDALWADFLKDVGPKKSGDTQPKPETDKTEGTSNGTASESHQERAVESDIKPEVKEKVTLTKVFDFAGEEVRVTEEVDGSSKMALQSAQPSRRPAVSLKPRGGLSSMVAQLGKKKKMSVLEKSRLDWNSFKRKEDIEDELDQFKKSKNSYLDKKEFLERADYRQYELERDIRMGTSKR